MFHKFVATWLPVLLWCSIASASDIKFNNYRVYSVNISNVEQLQQLQQLEQMPGWDFWRSPEKVGTTADIMVAPHQAAHFAEIASELNVESRLMVEDVQR